MARDLENVGFIDDTDIPKNAKQGVKKKEESKEKGGVISPSSKSEKEVSEPKDIKPVTSTIKLPGYLDKKLNAYIFKEKEKGVRMYDYVLDKERLINKSAVIAEAVREWMIKRNLYKVD